MGWGGENERRRGRGAGNEGRRPKLKIYAYTQTAVRYLARDRLSSVSEEAGMIPARGRSVTEGTTRAFGKESPMNNSS